LKCVAGGGAAAPTVVEVVPVIVPLPVSVAVIERRPLVVSVKLKVCAPLSPRTKV